MSCNRCGCGFSLFKKENYCRNCGFAFCNGCLSKKVHVPKLGTDSKHSVCHTCFGVLTRAKPEVNANITPRSASPPAALQRRMEALPRANIVQMPVNHANGSSNGASRVDKQIADRLAGLRADRAPPVPVQTLPQLEERLARLKGLPSACTVAATAQSNVPQPIPYQQPETKTYDEQIQDLLQQFTQRVDLDSRTPKPEDEIAARLARLRADDASMNDLNKPPANIEPPSPTTAPPTVPAATSTPPSGNSDDDEMSRVYRYMLEAERESRREAEEALTLQARDDELKKKLEEIRANRDVPKRKRVASSGPVGGDLSDEDNEDKIADKVIKQFLNESMIDSAVGAVPTHQQSSKRKSSERHKEEKLLNFNHPREPDEDEDELPWCAICNEDATLRCYGCEGDLYCRRCFRECHTGQDVRDHKMAPFNSKTDLSNRSKSYIDS